MKTKRAAKVHLIFFIVKNVPTSNILIKGMKDVNLEKESAKSNFMST
jgi:hypothetical protein